jgi:hypothetical protein
VIDGPQMFVAVIKAKSPTRAAQRGGARPDPRELFRVKIVGAWFCEYAATPIIELSHSSNDRFWRKAAGRFQEYYAFLAPLRLRAAKLVWCFCSIFCPTQALLW